MAQRKDKSQAMREKILNTATQLFIQKGSEKTSMQDIAQTAGISKGAIYHHFKSKDEIVLAVLRSRQELMEEEMKQWAANLYIATDDGSYGFKGNVNDCLKDLLANHGKEYTRVVAIGPMIMMKFVCLTTKELGIPTIVSMNPIMVDGTGMCGACRISIGDDVKFACVDGPEFDGWLVNFDEAMKRQQMFKSEEGRKTLRKQDGPTHSSPNCQIGGKH